MKISSMIRQYRYYLTKAFPDKYFTQQDFASYMGVSLSTVKFWETGRCRPSYSCMMDILSYMKLDIRILPVEFVRQVQQLVRDEYGIFYLLL